MIKTILFDLDGTLLQMDENLFMKLYFHEIQKVFTKHEMDPELSMKAFMAGYKAMVLNDGSMTNEDRFWKTFTDITQIPKESLEEDLIDFYSDNFQKVKSSTKAYENLQATLDLLIERGYTLILATNPLFPPIATQSRVKWAGLKIDSFKEITTFDNYHYSKPNPAYFQEIMDKHQLKPEECLMVGNDVQEDLIIATLGVKTYLIKNNLINRNESKEFLCDYSGEMKDFIEFVNSSLPILN